ncbi:MAG: PQQ-dependent sugar dehydrogenase [Terrimicrobiaceae bacterium]|nr:PQQ-dependent sugar dehydrogenase [Terrimicrobiaceae bacterium]
MILRHTLLKALFASALPALSNAALPLFQVEPMGGSAFSGGYVTDVVPSPTKPGRLYVAAALGTLHAVENGNATPVLNLYLQGSGETGLLGIAFSPNFSTDRRLYAFIADQGTSRVVRYTFAPGESSIEPQPPVTVLEFPRTNNTHVGGQIRFGPDGFLYIAVGDDGAAGSISEKSQDLTNFHGKILRIDVDDVEIGTSYQIPPGNPLLGEGNAAPEIIAWGLRNPWRFAFHPITGDLFIGDAGERAREEINVLPAGSRTSGVNFGWPYLEGTQPVAGKTNPGRTLTPPAYEYPTESVVIGGDFFTEGSAASDPIYLFGDAGGTIRSLTQLPDGTYQATVLATGHWMTCFGRDHDGRVIVGSTYGPIKRLFRATQVAAPILKVASGTYVGPARITWDNPNAQAALRYTLDGTDPTESSPLVQNPLEIWIWSPGEVRARAFYPGATPSSVVTGTYQLKAPAVYMPWSPLNDYTQVTLRSSYFSNLTVRYTTNNTPVTETSSTYAESPPAPDLWVTGPKVIRARAYYPGWLPGDEAVTSYTLTVGVLTASVAKWGDRARAGAPIQLSSTTTGATWRYTTDGTFPTENSPKLPDSLPAVPGVKLMIGGFKPGMNPAFLTLNETAVFASTGTLYQITPTGSPSTESSGPIATTVVNTPKHVLASPTGDLFVAGAVYSSSIWRLANGQSTRLYSGVHSDSFVELHLSPAGDLWALNKSTFSSTALTFPAPGYSRGPNASSFASATFSFEPSGSVLWGINDRIERSTPPSLTRTQVANAGGQITRITLTSAGEIFVGTADRTIKRVSGSTVVPFVGTGSFYSVDGPASQASFGSVGWMCSDRLGNLYVVETSETIRKIRPDGFVSTLVGVHEPLPGSTWQRFSGPVRANGQISVDENGVLYGAVNGYVWKFVQDDWDNDGIPDAEEVAPFQPGRDDRESSDGVPSPVNEFLFGDSPSASQRAALRPLSAARALVGLEAVPGSRVSLEMSLDAVHWYGLPGKWTVPSSGHISETVDFHSGTRSHFYRWRVSPP